MNTEYENKCFSNWYEISEHIRKEYESIPIAKNTCLFIVLKPGENSILAELKIDCDKRVYLKASSFDMESDFNVRQMRDEKMSEHVVRQRVNIFCLCIQSICINWDRILSVIKNDKSNYEAVMNFKI